MNPTRLTFDRARSEVSMADSRYQEHRLPWDQLFAVPGAIRAGERTFQLEDSGLARVCGQVGAPATYLPSLPEDLQATLLNHHFREDEASRKIACIIACGDRLVGLGRGDLGRIAGEEVVEAVMEGSGRQESELEVVNLHLDDSAFELDVVSPFSSSEITPGDVIQAGVRIRYSPTNEFATTVEAFALRLVCLNGMTQRECLGPRRTPRTRRLPSSHPDAGRLQRDQIRRLTDESWKRIERRLHGLHELTTQPADFDRLTSTWLQRVRLSVDRYVPHLRLAWEQEGAESTVYGVMNAFTRAANFEEIPDRGRAVLARLGGLLAFESQHLCPNCFAMVAESN